MTQAQPPRRRFFTAALLCAAVAGSCWMIFPAAAGLTAAGCMVQAAKTWLAALAPEQVAVAQKPFEDPQRTGWHFVPKFQRKGLSLREMNPVQQHAALDLLRAAISPQGYETSLGIMQRDEILRLIEGEKAKNIRDAQRYFFTLFGTPEATGSWGLSVEGHHLSLNFTVRDGRVVDSTQQFMGASPAEVRTALPGQSPVGHRLLKDEETLAFELVRALDAPQRAIAIVAPEAPRDIRAAGEAQAPPAAPQGIPFEALNPQQQALLRRIVEASCAAMHAEVAADRLAAIEKAQGGWNAVRFAWAGALEPGIGHWYLVENPAFSLEFCNVQPDAEGNPANHVHCIYRDRSGDFDLPPR